MLRPDVAPASVAGDADRREAQAMRDVIDEVLAIEKGFWTRADDPHYFEEHIADGGISVIEPMGVIDRERAVEMAADAPWSDVEVEDVVTRQVTPDLVVLAYRGSARRSSDGRPYRGRIASAYVRQDGRWVLALTTHQQLADDR
jgi:hypothetical protein